MTEPDRLRWPIELPADAVLGQPAWYGVTDVAEALSFASEWDDWTIAFEGPAEAVRRPPEDLYMGPTTVAVCSVPGGFRLEIGRGDLSEIPEELRADGWQRAMEADWAGTVTELVWLHGKACPYLEEFRSSRLHMKLLEVWPDCSVWADAFL